MKKGEKFGGQERRTGQGGRTLVPQYSGPCLTSRAKPLVLEPGTLKSRLSCGKDFNGKPLS